MIRILRVDQDIEMALGEPNSCMHYNIRWTNIKVIKSDRNKAKRIFFLGSLKTITFFYILLISNCPTKDLYVILYSHHKGY